MVARATRVGLAPSPCFFRACLVCVSDSCPPPPPPPPPPSPSPLRQIHLYLLCASFRRRPPLLFHASLFPASAPTPPREPPVPRFPACPSALFSPPSLRISQGPSRRTYGVVPLHCLRVDVLRRRGWFFEQLRAVGLDGPGGFEVAGCSTESGLLFADTAIQARVSGIPLHARKGTVTC